MDTNQTEYQKGDILIVNDDHLSLSTLSSILTVEGYQVRGVADGLMALTMIETKPPELILLDARTPDMDVFELCRQLKADEKVSDIPILFLAALGELEDKVKGLAAGVVDFISKPFQVDEVLARVDTHITLSRLRKNLERQVVERTVKIKQYKQIVESTNTPVGLVDRNFIYQYVNGSYCQAFKKSADEIIGHSVTELFGRNFFETVLKSHYNKCFAGENVNYQEWFNFPGWGRRYMDVRYYPFWEATGRVAAVVINAHDITEIKQLDMRLKESQERFRTFMDHNPASIYIKDENDIHVYANPAAFKDANKKPEEFIGATTRDLWPPQIADRLIELDRKVLNEDIPLITEEWGDEQTGETTWRRDIKFPIALESGKKLLGGISLDITEIKQFEQELAEQLEFERLIADIASQLAQTEPEQLDESIDSTLQALGKFFGTQRAFLGEFTDDGKSLYHRSIWAAEGIDVPSFFFELDMAAASPWFAQQIRTGNVINTGPELADLPAESGDLRERLKREGINSGIVVPVCVEGSSMGMIGLDNVDQPREFSPSIVDRLKIAANTVGATLHRIESQTALQGSLEKIRQLRKQLEQENIYLREEIEVNHKHEEIVGKSKSIVEMLSRAEQVAETESTVLILGETGTGKELLARSIHKLSSRQNRQMIKVNCAALPPTLIESELFGREKGAFTGAMTRQIGRFEIADGSTIFLDEIGELPMEVQAKLLRVLQEGQFERLGNPKTISVNVRIIASTNRDLARALASGRFREDLYYRLNVFSVTVPPLRDRSEDIPLLVWTFVKEFEKSMGKAIEKISQKSIDALQQYSWPGNIRELKNVVEKAMIISTGKMLKLTPPADSPIKVAKDLKLEVVERNHIIDVLEKTAWRVSGERGAAKLLGLKPTTLESRMKKLGIVRPR